ncbi:MULTISPECIES: winged helix-turn-helix domain-containing protein [Planotetraspora]|jgi:DNA-binding transcriptional ArsR family regulator|uniref:MarR family transcriptional regulator n=2 Tax=Planotetraspora TaxID=58120 RepID=A0A8J3UI62_9ACTN|nr:MULTISPECIES: transcriptional regulator [Planotetraspora]GII29648.1 MarR family transcriptional regulator [Planotetraspora mira]GII45407.1 MarR family transcriptional regulator [Planotetraspora silvatica]
MELDPVIHAPTRLQIVSVLAAAEEAEFGFVRDTLGISDSVLSKHASALETAGYVRIRKGYVGKRPKTWFSLTEQGRSAFADYVRNLQKIVSPSGLTVLPG